MMMISRQGMRYLLEFFLKFLTGSLKICDKKTLSGSHCPTKSIS